MALANTTLYERVVRVTHIYLGPAADRFIDRQVQNHLKKSPEKISESDLLRLIDWIRVAVSLLTDDKDIVEEYVQQLRTLTETQGKPKRQVLLDDSN
jgi:hypothetical protein